jgi:acetyl/propionyl-CoA carboxylase alpha subunit
VLVANRGEIAVRIIRACRDLGMESVAIYSDPDASAGHVRAADLAVRVGPAQPTESYLRIDRILEAAIATGAQAIHPGYGFLAERADFARAVEDAGLIFVGPSSRAIAALGDKLAARRGAASAGVAVVPGTFEPAPVDRPDQVEAVLAVAAHIGFPLMVKAAAGGGGRGMRRVASPKDLPAALVAGSREAAAAFGDGSVYLEQEVRPARHVEVQLLGDHDGRIVALGERDCSVQRRHQKLVEEAPAPGLSREQRVGLHAMAVRAAAAAGLTNAATAEFLLDPSGAFWFLEVNTRLQVEHGVTELVTGLDIVAEQFWIAAGRPLSPAVLVASSAAADPSRHAIEIRLSAEDPASDFAPAPGRVGRWRMPAGPGVRVDTAIEAGERIPPDYDPLIAKIMVEAADRATAIQRLSRALDEVEVTGVQTTLPFHRALVRNPRFGRGDVSTDWVAEEWDGPAERAAALEVAAIAAGLAEIEAATNGRRAAGGRGAVSGEGASGLGAAPSGEGLTGRAPSAAGPTRLAPTGQAPTRPAPSGEPAPGEGVRARRERPQGRSGGWAAAARRDAVDRWPA